MIDSNKQDTDDKMRKKYYEFIKIKSEVTKIMTIIKEMMFQNHHSSSDKMQSPKAQYNNTVVPSNRKAPPSESGHHMKNYGM